MLQAFATGPFQHAVPTVVAANPAKRPYSQAAKSPTTVMLAEHPGVAAATVNCKEAMSVQLEQLCEVAYTKGMFDGATQNNARSHELLTWQQQKIDLLEAAVDAMTHKQDETYKQDAESMTDDMKDRHSTHDAHSQSMTMSAADVIKVRRRQPSPGSFSPSLTPSSTRAVTRAKCCMCVHCADPCRHSATDRGDRHCSFWSACLSARSLACLYLGQNCRVCPKKWQCEHALGLMSAPLGPLTPHTAASCSYTHCALAHSCDGICPSLSLSAAASAR